MKTNKYQVEWSFGNETGIAQYTSFRSALRHYKRLVRYKRRLIILPSNSNYGKVIYSTGKW